MLLTAPWQVSSAEKKKMAEGRFASLNSEILEKILSEKDSMKIPDGAQKLLWISSV